MIRFPLFFCAVTLLSTLEVRSQGRNLHNLKTISVPIEHNKEISFKGSSVVLVAEDRNATKTEVSFNQDLILDVLTSFDKKLNIICNNCSGDTIYIRSPKINVLHIYGPAIVSVEKEQKEDSLSIFTYNASRVYATVYLKKLKLNALNASSIVLKGSTEHLYVSTNDASTVKAFDLVSASANVITAKSSSAQVNVAELISVQSLNNSIVSYKGNGKVIKVNSGATSLIYQNR